VSERRLAPPLQRICTGCGAALRPTAKFCDECGQPVTGSAARSPSRSPASYTPKHLADKILTSRAAREGERKQHTPLCVADTCAMSRRALRARVEPRESGAAWI